MGVSKKEVESVEIQEKEKEKVAKLSIF